MVNMTHEEQQSGSSINREGIAGEEEREWRREEAAYLAVAALAAIYECRYQYVRIA